MPRVTVKTKPTTPMWSSAWNRGPAKPAQTVAGPPKRTGSTTLGLPARPAVRPAIPPAGPAVSQSPITALDPGSEASMVAINKGLNDTLAGVAARRSSVNAQFYDPNDPRSRQAELKRQFNNLGAQQRNNQAGQGQLYSGSSGTENALTVRDEGYANVDLKREFDSVMGGLSAQEQGSRNDAALQTSELVRAGSAAYAQDPNRTPVGTGDMAGAAAARTRPKPPRTAAQQAAMVARVKAKIVARKRASR